MSHLSMTVRPSVLSILLGTTLPLTGWPQSSEALNFQNSVLASALAGAEVPTFPLLSPTPMYKVYQTPPHTLSCCNNTFGR